MVAEGKVLGQGGAAGVGGEELHVPVDVRAEVDEEVEDAGLGDPVGLRVRPALASLSDARAGAQEARGRALLDVHPRLGAVEPEDADGRVRRLGVHDGDRAVERHGAVVLVLEHVQVEQPVRVRVVAGVLALGAAQGEGRGVLRDAKDVVVADKSDVEGERLGALGLRVGLVVEALLPLALVLLLEAGPERGALLVVAELREQAALAALQDELGLLLIALGELGVLVRGERLGLGAEVLHLQ